MSGIDASNLNAPEPPDPDRAVVLTSSFLGRNRTPRDLKPGDLVRFELRLRADLAERLYARANELEQPVSRTAAALLKLALDTLETD